MEIYITYAIQIKQYKIEVFAHEKENNMKICTKLITAFIALTIIISIAGFVGFNIFWTIVLGIVLSIAFAIYIAKGITKPLEELSKVTKGMENGTYNATIGYESQDEVGMLAENMRKMMKNTNDVIIDISHSLDQISQGNFDHKPTLSYIGVFQRIERSLGKIIVDLSGTMQQIKMSSDRKSVV